MLLVGNEIVSVVVNVGWSVKLAAADSDEIKQHANVDCMKMRVGGTREYILPP